MKKETMTKVLKYFYNLSLSLTMLFVFLKVFDFVDWKWWWVLSPVWINLGMLILLIIIGFGGVALMKKIGDKK